MVAGVSYHEIYQRFFARCASASPFAGPHREITAASLAASVSRPEERRVLFGGEREHHRSVSLPYYRRRRPRHSFRDLFASALFAGDALRV